MMESQHKASLESILHQMSAQESVLAASVCDDDAWAPLRYHDQGGKRLLEKTVQTSSELADVADLYRQAPLQCNTKMREAVAAVAYNEGEERTDRYMRGLIDLQTRLDHLAFKSRGVTKGVPDYIVDGLTDYGGTDPESLQSNLVGYGREPIYVDKKETLEKHKDVLTKALTNQKGNELQRRGRIAYEIGLDQHDGTAEYGKRTVPLSITVEKASVCRHLALRTQLAYQALGIPSRLFKNHVNFGTESELELPEDGERHAANLMKAGDSWFIVEPSTATADGQNNLTVCPTRTNKPEHVERVMDRTDQYRMGWKGHGDIYTDIDERRPIKRLK